MKYYHLYFTGIVFTQICISHIFNTGKIIGLGPDFIPTYYSRIGGFVIKEHSTAGQGKTGCKFNSSIQ